VQVSDYHSSRERTLRVRSHVARRPNLGTLAIRPLVADRGVRTCSDPIRFGIDRITFNCGLVGLTALTFKLLWAGNFNRLRLDGRAPTRRSVDL